MKLKEGVLYSDVLASQPVIHGFTTKALGNLGFGKNPNDPEVHANRNRFFQTLGLTNRVHIQPRQVHSDRAVCGADFVPGCEADASFTRDPNHVLSVLTADCVPVMIYFPEGVVAAIHAGWRGLLDEIIPKTLASLPHGGLAAIGPAIGRCCYEVSEDLAADFASKFGNDVVDRSRVKPHLDLVRVAMEQLDSGGIAEVDAAHLCTHCHPDLFFSYRRDGSSGRMMSFIGLR